MLRSAVEGKGARREKGGRSDSSSPTPRLWKEVSVMFRSWTTATGIIVDEEDVHVKT